jgi:hypothetical protein
MLLREGSVQHSELEFGRMVDRQDEKHKHIVLELMFGTTISIEISSLSLETILREQAVSYTLMTRMKLFEI